MKIPGPVNLCSLPATFIEESQEPQAGCDLQGTLIEQGTDRLVPAAWAGGDWSPCGAVTGRRHGTRSVALCIGLKGPHHHLGPTNPVRPFMFKGTTDIWVRGEIVNTWPARAGGHKKPNSQDRSRVGPTRP